MLSPVLEDATSVLCEMAREMNQMDDDGTENSIMLPRIREVEMAASLLQFGLMSHDVDPINYSGEDWYEAETVKTADAILKLCEDIRKIRGLRRLLH